MSNPKGRALTLEGFASLSSKLKSLAVDLTALQPPPPPPWGQEVPRDLLCNSHKDDVVIGMKMDPTDSQGAALFERIRT